MRLPKHGYLQIVSAGTRSALTNKLESFQCRWFGAMSNGCCVVRMTAHGANNLVLDIVAWFMKTHVMGSAMGARGQVAARGLVC